MAPDLNSLPPSSPVAIAFRTMANGGTNTTTAANTNTSADINTSASPSGEPAMRRGSPSPSPRSTSLSLQAAATVNASLQHEPGRRSSIGSLSRQRHSPQASRRRSTVLMNLQLNDPALPAPGEMVSDGGGNAHRTISPQPLSSSPLLASRDPHHNRAPSLGELHQELEAEQEAQVNRLLQMIRQQQLQLQQLQAAQGQPQSSVAAEDPPSASDRTPSMSRSTGVPPPLPTPSGALPGSPSTSASHPRSSFDTARDALHRRSRTPSRGASPSRLRSPSMGQEAESYLLGVRDEAAYYQAETQSLIRENQMLRHRMRELERQLSEAHANASITREPVQPSHLTHSTSVSDDDALAGPSAVTSQLISASEAKEE
ncbi:putative FAD dependent oxidoreductase [Rosellinia necatrix]|uniref:Putative FAD dependent oxidoreductase n=1 Tax=Rosellinia necatrix TaxID=77044 RepID=A0A1W2TE56_ROSNE|nr:putative FAD dependent oxidoreductase [Rosellinia necatrix]